MNSTNPIQYYVNHFYRGENKQKIIDFNLGLGKFLLNSGTLSNRVLLDPGQTLDLESNYTYRRYYFDIATHRFAYDLEFTAEHFDNGTLSWTDNRECIMHEGKIFSSLHNLGVHNSPNDINTILSKKRRK